MSSRYAPNAVVLLSTPLLVVCLPPACPEAPDGRDQYTVEGHTDQIDAIGGGGMMIDVDGLSVVSQ